MKLARLHFLPAFIDSGLNVKSFSLLIGNNYSYVSKRMADEAYALRSTLNLHRYVRDITAKPLEMKKEKAGWMAAINDYNVLINKIQRWK